MEQEKPVRVYSPELELLHETSNYSSLQFTFKFYETGDFELNINQHMEGSEYFQKDNIIVLEKRENKAGIIKHREISLDASGKESENWIIKGKTIDGVLNQRVTVPPDHTSYDRKSGDAETVMKHYVDRNFINPDDSDRKIPLLEIAPNKNRGGHVSYESRYKNVDEEITAIAKQGNLGFAIFIDIERKKWIFDVISPQDLTEDNAAGYEPVFFSPDFNTISEQQFVDSDTNYKNVGYVGGQGEGVDRNIIELGSRKGLNRIETFVDARDVGTTEDDEEELSDAEINDLLVERGQEKMAEFRTNFYLEAQILTPSISANSYLIAMSSPFEYEIDFDLGSIVQVFNRGWNLTMDAPITEVTEIYEQGGFALEAVFGEAQPTFITKIKRKFDEISGIETQEFPSRIAVEKMQEAIEHADSALTAEQLKRIEQAQQILEDSKGFASEEAYQAIQDSKEYTDTQDVFYDDVAKTDATNKSNNAQDNAKDHADIQDTIFDEIAKVDAKEKADQAESNANDYAENQADIAENQAIDEAARDAKVKADAAQKAAESVAIAESGLAETRSNAYADGIVDVEEQARIDADIQAVADAQADAEAKADAAELAASNYAAQQAQAAQEAAERYAQQQAEAEAEAAQQAAYDYAVSKTQYNQKVTELTDDILSKVNITDYNIKIDEINADIAEKAGLTYVDGQLQLKANDSVVSDLQTEVASKVDGEWVNGQLQVAIDDVNADIATKADAGNVYVKTDIDTMLDNKVSVTAYQTDQEGIITDLESHETRLTQNETDISSKVSSTVYSQKITDLESDISSKSDNSTVNAIETRMSNAETAINQNDDAILLKANSTDVYTKSQVDTSLSGKADNSDVSSLETRVNTNEAELSVQADEIASKVDTSTYTTDQNGNIEEFENHNTRINQNATDISSKAETSSVNNLDGRVDTAFTEINQNATAINSKASQTSVNTLSGRVDTTETNISQNASDIALKASQNEVDSLSGNVSSNAAAINVNAEEINTKVAQSSYNSMLEVSALEEDATNSKYIPGANSGKWYRIALNTGSRAWARFIVRDTTSSQHGTIMFTAGSHYNRKNRIEFTLLSYAMYSNFPFSKIRFLTSGTYDDQYIDLYFEPGRESIDSKVQYWIKENIQSSGWQPVDFEEASVPSGYDITEFPITQEASVGGKLTTHETSIDQNKEEINLKASSAIVDNIEGRVTTAEGEISTIAGQVSTKAESSTVTELSSKMTTAEQDINALEGDISTKVESTSFDALSGRVDTAFTEISQNATAINLKAEASTVTSIGDRVSTAEIAIDGLESDISLKADTVDLDAFVTANDLAVRGDLTFGGHLDGATGTFSGSVETDDGVGNKVQLENGEIRTHQFGVLLATLNRQGLTFFSNAGNETGTLLNATIAQNGLENAEHGISLNTDYDFISMGHGPSGDTSRLFFLNKNAKRQTVLAGANNSSWDGLLELRSSYLDQSDQEHVPKTIIVNNTSDGVWGGIINYVGRNNNPHNASNERYGFEIWKYTGDGSGGSEMIFMSDYSTHYDSKITKITDRLTIGYENAQDERISIHYDPGPGHTYFSTNDNGVWRHRMAFSYRGEGPIYFYDDVHVNSSTGRYVAAGQVTLRAESGRGFLQTDDEFRVTRPGTVSGYKPIRASGHYTGSLEDFKQEITPWTESALDYINRSVIYEYRLKNDSTQRLRQGLVIGKGYETPEKLIDDDAIEQYQMISWTWKGVQELSDQFNEHDTRIAYLELENQYLKGKIKVLEQSA